MKDAGWPQLHKLCRLIPVGTVAVLSACGGGGGDDETGSSGGASSGTAFITWVGSANGTAVLDRDNKRFAVRVSDRVVVDLAQNSTLGGRESMRTVA